MSKALLLIDCQVDFAEGGNLGVEGATKIYSDIAEYVKKNYRLYDFVGLTKDDHIDPGEHWSETPDYVDTWPRHCERGTDGWHFHPNIEPVFDYVTDVFYKGQYSAAYSGFEGIEIFGDTLDQRLTVFGIDEIVVVGNEFAHCVRATAVSGAKLGYKVTVLYDLCAKLYDDNTETFQEFDKYGILGG